MKYTLDELKSKRQGDDYNETTWSEIELLKVRDVEEVNLLTSCLYRSRITDRIDFLESNISIIVYCVEQSLMNGMSWTEWVLRAKLQKDGYYTYKILDKSDGCSDQSGPRILTHYRTLLKKTAKNKFAIRDIDRYQGERLHGYNIRNGWLRREPWKDVGGGD